MGFKAALQVRPVRLKVGPGKGSSDPNAGAVPDLKTFKVPEAVKTIGCLFSSVPPNRVYVQQVDGASWAEEKGVRVGWELTTLNGQVCSKMSADAFRTAMRSRPLTLAFDAKAAPSSEDLSRAGWRPSVTQAAADKAAADRKAAEKAAADKEKADREKAAADRAAEEKAKKDKAEADKAAAEKAAADKAAAESNKKELDPRQVIINDFFKAADTSKTGRLKRFEMWKVAIAFGFPPEDPEEEFQDEYEDICKEFHLKQEVGLDLEAFGKLLNDQDSEEWYVEDAKLKRLLNDKFLKTS